MLSKIKTDKGKEVIKFSLNKFVENMNQNIIIWGCLFVVSVFVSAFVFVIMSPQFTVSIGTLLALTAAANGQSFEMAYAVFGLVVTVGLHVIVISVGALKQWDNYKDDDEFDKLLEEKVTLSEMIEWSSELTSTERETLSATLIEFIALEDGANGAELLDAVKAS